MINLQLKNLFTIKNMLTVRTGGGKAGDSAYFNNGVGSVAAACLTDVKAGEAIALLTDKGNWYLMGEAVSSENISTKRIIEYRKTTQNVVKEFLKDFIILAQTGEATSGNINLNNSSFVHFAGIEHRTISIDWLTTTVGTVFTITYPGGVATTDPTPVESVGQFQVFTFEYTPSPTTDGSFTISTSGTISYQYFNDIFYYVTNGKQIQKLNFSQSEQVKNFYPNNKVYLSVGDSKIYVSFLLGFISISTPVYERVRLITIDLLTLVEESSQEFIYAGDNQINIDNTDWRKSVTHSFLVSPPDNAIACINTYRKNNYAYIDTIKNKIILSGTFTLEPGKKKEASVSKFNPSSSICSTNFKKVLVKSKSISDLLPQYFCNVAGVSVYR